MKNSIVIGLFSRIKTVIFQNIGKKLRPGAFKIFIDSVFIIFEKISHNFDFIFNSYVVAYEDIVEKEVRLTGISKVDSVLVIGCGSVPSTSVLIAEKTNAKVVSIDVDKSAVNSSQKIIKKLDLSDKVDISLVKDDFYQVDDFDFIFVLYGVKKIDKIFENIFKNGKSSVKVVLRSSSKDLKNFEGFKIVDKTTSDAFGLVYSFLLEKK